MLRVWGFGAVLGVWIYELRFAWFRGLGARLLAEGRYSYLVKLGELLKVWVYLLPESPIPLSLEIDLQITYNFRYTPCLRGIDWALWASDPTSRSQARACLSITCRVKRPVVLDVGFSV